MSAPRNDSVLYTGGSSLSFNRQDKRPQRVVERAQSRDKLLPAAPVIMEEIDRTIASLSVPDPKKVKQYSFDSLPGTLELYINSRLVAAEELKSFKQRLENILRDNKGAK